ncbi:glycosyltransferase family 9 protein [Cetobacterium sp. 8H]|uniref:glycosyltransferase family 9 protein n=1 Tax=Cetobacterium sp. 8H TaxID=2759681 RepID=UPI00163C9899|nr:glycosyltransferase family 9 protein [Cetobacterium sp. 8H]MBC2850691.1 glycosyltransferase family 9 protein [Cetobacterium sp. 8H]
MKVLIIHTAFIGDIALSTPLLKRVKEVYPEAKITYVTTPVGASLLRNNPNITEIIEYDKRGHHSGLKGILELGRRLRYENFNLVLTPHRYLRSSFLSWLTRSPQRVGYDIASGAIFFNKKIKYDKSKHEVEKLLSFLGEVPEYPREKYPIELYPSQKDIKKIDEIWNENNLNDKEIIVIAPGSKWFTKKWPLEYFNKVIDLLLKDNKKIVVIGGRDEMLLNIEQADKVIDLRGKTTLLELAEVLKRSKVVITNDSSPIHIASAFKDTHIVAIFGPTVEKFGFFPWSLNSEVLEDKELECRPCAIHGGDKCPKGHFKCMLSITPEEVYKKVVQSLKEA